MLWVAPALVAGVLAVSLKGALDEETCWRRLEAGQAWLADGNCSRTPPQSRPDQKPLSFSATSAKPPH